MFFCSWGLPTDEDHIKKKKDPRQMLYAWTKLHVAWSDTMFQLLFSYSEQKIHEKAAGLDNTSKQFICSGLCTNKINRIKLLQEFSDSSKYPNPNASSSNFSGIFAFSLQLIWKPLHFQTPLFKYGNFCFTNLFLFFIAISLTNDLCKDLLKWVVWLLKKKTKLKHFPYQKCEILRG